MTFETLITILGMSLVTFLPRVSSMVWFGKVKPNAFWQRFFNFIPYAMLSVLIFPDAFEACGTVNASLIGITAAISISLMKKSATTVVLGAVICVYFFLAFMSS